MIKTAAKQKNTQKTAVFAVVKKYACFIASKSRPAGERSSVYFDGHFFQKMC
jgi:hypothetical protein